MSRRTTTLLPAAAALVLLLGGCGGSDSEGASQYPAPTTESDSPTESAAPLELTVPEAPTGRCAVPNAQVLSTMDVAFEGTVTQADDTSATLEVERWFTGGDADLVTVATPSEQLRDRGFAVDFEPGKTYLVSATDGSVSLCGFSAETSPELEATYEEAYATP